MSHYLKLVKEILLKSLNWIFNPGIEKIMNRYLLLLLIIMPFMTISAKRGEEKWEKLQDEVKENRFSMDMRDSLLKHYKIAEDKGLRAMEDKKLPFSSSEVLVYKGGWGPMSAGYGILNNSVDEEKGTVLLTAKGVTNNFVSAFYKIRDYVVSEVDLSGLYPRFFEQHIEENKYKKKSWFLFDPKGKKVYSNRRKKKSEYDASAFTYDYLSLLLYLRTMDFAPGDTFSKTCFVHGKDYPVFFKVHNKEKVEVEAGTYDCIMVEPKLVGRGRNFTEKDKMYLWFTDDDKKLLVKAKSKVKLGHVKVELIHYESK